MKAVLETYSERKSRINQLPKAQMIFQRASTGDKLAVEDCINAYGNTIWALARKYTETNAEAEKVVLDIFKDLWKYAEHFESVKCSEIIFVWIVASRRLNLSGKEFYGE